MTKTSANLAARLESLIGASHVAAGPSVCADYAVDAVLPSAVAKPASAEEVAAIVRFAALEKLAIVPCGNRTKLRIGMPPSRYDLALDMTALVAPGYSLGFTLNWPWLKNYGVFTHGDLTQTWSSSRIYTEYWYDKSAQV